MADIEAEIASEFSFTAADGVLGQSELGTKPASWTGLHHITICVLVLHNGHKVVGVNHGPVDPANFDAELGRKYAREDAIAKLWEPLGFRLRDKMARDALSRPALTEADAAADLAGTPRPSSTIISMAAMAQGEEAAKNKRASRAIDVVANRPDAIIPIPEGVDGLLFVQPHEQRVIAEHAELVDRMKKLTTFRLGRVVGRLSQLDQELLREQEEAMSRYAAVLSKRIARFSQATDPCTCGPGEGCSNCHPATSPAAEPSRVITPTIGRKVWFHPGSAIPEGMSVFPGGQPLDATVVYVWHDRMVNLLVVDHAGKQHAVTSVYLLQPGDFACPSSYAEWMPYQVKQAGAA